MSQSLPPPLSRCLMGQWASASSYHPFPLAKMERNFPSSGNQLSKSCDYHCYFSIAEFSFSFFFWKFPNSQSGIETVSFSSLKLIDYFNDINNNRVGNADGFPHGSTPLNSCRQKNPKQLQQQQQIQLKEKKNNNKKEKMWNEYKKILKIKKKISDMVGQSQRRLLHLKQREKSS